LEVNPRASRTVPFVSKCIGHSLAKIAARCMVGVSLADQNFTKEIVLKDVAVKEAVFPFAKFLGVDPILGPEMKSTGEVMGLGDTFPEAFYKASIGAGDRLPETGRAFLSVKDSNKEAIVKIAEQLQELGFELMATAGTARVLQEAGMAVERVNKVKEGRPHIVDKVKNDEIALIVNTTEGAKAIADSFEIRRSALQHKVCYSTTIAGAEAICQALRYHRDTEKVRKLQDREVVQ